MRPPRADRNIDDRWSEALPSSLLAGLVAALLVGKLAVAGGGTRGRWWRWGYHRSRSASTTGCGDFADPASSTAALSSHRRARGRMRHQRHGGTLIWQVGIVVPIARQADEAPRIRVAGALILQLLAASRLDALSRASSMSGRRLLSQPPCTQEIVSIGSPGQQRARS